MGANRFFGMPMIHLDAGPDTSLIFPPVEPRSEHPLAAGREPPYRGVGNRRQKRKAQKQARKRAR